MNALSLLIEHDYRDRDLVSTIIYSESREIEKIINYLNGLNNDTA